MTFESRERATEALADALGKHFPAAAEAQRINCADEIYDGYNTAISLQRIERANVRPERDIADLILAADHLGKACNALSRLGWNGGRELVPMAQQIAGSGPPYPWTPAIGYTEAAEVVSNHIAKIRRDLAGAAKRIDPVAAPVFDYLGYDFSAGRPTETAAYFTAQECAKAYLKLAGEPPTRRTDWADGTAYGPFFDMVQCVFETLGLTASVENAVRKAVSMEKSPED